MYWLLGWWCSNYSLFTLVYHSMRWLLHSSVEFYLGMSHIYDCRFLLVYGSLNELKTITDNALTGSVRSYSDVTGVFFLINYLISAIFKLRRTMPRG